MQSTMDKLFDFNVLSDREKLIMFMTARIAVELFRSDDFAYNTRNASNIVIPMGVVSNAIMNLLQNDDKLDTKIRLALDIYEQAKEVLASRDNWDPTIHRVSYD